MRNDVIVLVPGSSDGKKMSVFKWHPLYECQHVPERSESDRKLFEQVKKLKAEGKKIKAEKDKKKMKFECPYFDPLTSNPCGTTYSTYRYPGAIKHLRTCSFKDGPGNQARLKAYLLLKKIKLQS